MQIIEKADEIVVNYLNKNYDKNTTINILIYLFQNTHSWYNRKIRIKILNYLKYIGKKKESFRKLLRETIVTDDDKIIREKATKLLLKYHLKDSLSFIGGVKNLDIDCFFLIFDYLRKNSEENYVKIFQNINSKDLFKMLNIEYQEDQIIYNKKYSIPIILRDKYDDSFFSNINEEDYYNNIPYVRDGKKMLLNIKLLRYIIEEYIRTTINYNRLLTSHNSRQRLESLAFRKKIEELSNGKTIYVGDFRVNNYHFKNIYSLSVFQRIENYININIEEWNEKKEKRSKASKRARKTARRNARL